MVPWGAEAGAAPPKARVLLLGHPTALRRHCPSPVQGAGVGVGIGFLAHFSVLHLTFATWMITGTWFFQGEYEAALTIYDNHVSLPLHPVRLIRHLPFSL